MSNLTESILSREYIAPGLTLASHAPSCRKEALRSNLSLPSDVEKPPGTGHNMVLLDLNFEKEQVKLVVLIRVSGSIISTRKTNNSYRRCILIRIDSRDLK